MIKPDELNQTSKRRVSLLIINALIYISLLILSFLICNHSYKSVSLQTKIAAATSVEGSADLALAELLEKLSFSLYEGASNRLATHELLVSKTLEEKTTAQIYAVVFFCIAVVWIAIQFFIAQQSGNKHRLWRHILIISLLCLIVGLIAPMMQMTAYKELPVLGDVVFKYEAKSIYSTVQSLFTNGNFIIALLIAFFSVFTPVVKISIVGMSLFNLAPSIHKRAHDLIHLLGKWSMADVFVVAILLSIFALDSQDFTRAETDLGVYFFATYCLLSLWVTHEVLQETE